MRALRIFSVSAVLFLGGCNLGSQQPAPAGPAGPAGQPGQPGQADQAGEPGQTGQAGQTGDTGQKGQTGDTGKAAPCPAGQHRSTSESGRAICLPD